MNSFAVIRLGRLDYRRAYALQHAYRIRRAAGQIGDVLLWVEHPDVITLGRGGGWEDLKVSPSSLKARGVDLVETDRGGRATYHGPGQFVVYPIIGSHPRDLHQVVEELEEVTIRVLDKVGIQGQRDRDYPGVWVGQDKIAAIGIASQDNVTYHGLALNVTTDLRSFQWIVPCGIAHRGVTSVAKASGQDVSLDSIAKWWFEEWARLRNNASWTWGFQDHFGLMAWAPQGNSVEEIYTLMHTAGLHTVCEEALCPNIGECWNEGTATFMLGGDMCTRHCRFCAVASGRPLALDQDEPERVAVAAARMNLKHVVVTAVARDDLDDGGAQQFADTIRSIRTRLPEATTEVLIPDFNGRISSLHTVLEAQPDILNHNVETVPRLYPVVQPKKSYARSLAILDYTKRRGISTKSGLILGMGESRSEVIRVLEDLRRVECDFLTIGQYLPPTPKHWLLTEYVHPLEFDWYAQMAKEIGFVDVVSGPLVRSSYHAGQLGQHVKSPPLMTSNRLAHDALGSQNRL